MVMKYITTNQVSKKWNISDRRVRVFCNEGRIEGAIKTGRNWSIPETAVRPIDNRISYRKTYMGIPEELSEIDSLKQSIDKHRPFSARISKMLQDRLVVEWTYNSNAIEGSTLTLSETKVILEGITVGGKSVIEHLEAINHREAILFMEEIVSRQETLNEWNIKQLHSLILKEIDSDNAGKYRMSNVIISGAGHTPPQYIELPDLMQELISEYNDEWRDLHPVVRAALLHGRFVGIHPFIDGNGRTARLLLNFELISNGFAPVIIQKENRLEYYNALDLAHTKNDYSLFIKLVSDLEVESQKLWLSVLE